MPDNPVRIRSLLAITATVASALLLAPAYGQPAAEGQPEPAITIKVVPASEAPRPSSNATNDDAQGAPADEPRNAPGGDEAASGSTKDDDADAAVTASDASDSDNAQTSSAAAEQPALKQEANRTDEPDTAAGAETGQGTKAEAAAGDAKTGAKAEDDEADGQVKAQPEQAEAAVSVREIPEVVSRLEQHGVDIVGEFQTPGGLRAFAGIAQQQPIAVYLTPDEEHVIIGTMLDKSGMDMTHGPLTEASLAPWTNKTWSALERTRWVADGNDAAPRVIYMFTDPNCPFCNKFWKQARPWVEGGHVQIRHILVGILTQTSPGKAAAILESANPAEALREHETAGIDGGISALDSIDTDTAEVLNMHAQLMEQLQIQGTPGIFYFDAENKLQIQRGAPLDDDLEMILGPRG